METRTHDELITILGGDCPPSFAPLDKSTIKSIEAAIRLQDSEQLKEISAGYTRRIDAYSMPQDIIFLGDSTIHLWKHGSNARIAASLFPKKKILIMGFEGDTASDLLWRIENGLLHFQKGASLILVHIGTNDSQIPNFYRTSVSADAKRERRSRNPRETFNLIRIATESIQKFCPQAKIKLHLILPRGTSPADRYRVINEEVNSLLCEYDWNEGISIVDIRRHFVDHAGMLLDITGDQVHYTPKGYELWGDALRDQLI